MNLSIPIFAMSHAYTIFIFLFPLIYSTRPQPSARASPLILLASHFQWVNNQLQNKFTHFFFLLYCFIQKPFLILCFFIFLLFRRLLFFSSQSILTGEKKMVYGVYFAVKTRILIAGLYPSMLFISHRCWFHLFCNSKVFSLCTLHFILFFSLRFFTFSFIYLCSVVLNLLL